MNSSGGQKKNVRFLKLVTLNDLGLLGAEPEHTLYYFCQSLRMADFYQCDERLPLEFAKPLSGEYQNRFFVVHRYSSLGYQKKRKKLAISTSYHHFGEFFQNDGRPSN